MKLSVFINLFIYLVTHSHMPKSFYNLDDNIELNEKRHEQIIAEYDKVIAKISNIIIVYTAVSFFFIPIAQDIVEGKMHNHLFWFCLILFSTIFLISFIRTVIFLWPRDVDTLKPPSEYYTGIRNKIEPKYTTDEKGTDKATVDIILKSAYNSEIETAINDNINIVHYKKGYYNKAFAFSLISMLPFVACLYFHIIIKDDKVQKVKIEGIEKTTNFTIDSSGRKTVLAPVVILKDSAKK